MRGRPAIGATLLRGGKLAALSLLAMAFVWVHALLATNPGYFSHDEFQWAAHAQQHGWLETLRTSLADLSAFQYRPLTFTLWTALSALLFDSPMAMHALWILLGLGNAAMLATVLRRFDVAAWPAALAAMAFALSPYAVYVHGWVATLGDLLWVGLALSMVLAICSRSASLQSGPRLAGLAAALTTLALLSKEAAVAIPALLCVGWWIDRRPRWGWALAGAATVTTLYLILRLEVILFDTPAASGYGWSLLRVPQRFVQYHLFTWYPWSFEVHQLMQWHPRRHLIIAAIMLACYLLAFRGTAAIVRMAAISAAALGPVLILDSAANQYGYAFAAVLVGALALAWPRTSRSGRAAIVVLGILSTWHGVDVARGVARAGSLQREFSPSLAAAVHALPDGAQLVLHPKCASDHWVYSRLTHQIPLYRGIPIGDRVILHEQQVDGGREIACDGSIRDER